MPVADCWLKHPDRRSYEGIEFAPGGARAGHYNLWRGFFVEPREGDCTKFLGHIWENIAQGDEEKYHWVVGWFAAIFQRPTVKMETALVLRGGQGVGKTKVGQVIGALLGDHYALVSSPRYVTGQFNAHMMALLLLHADEAFWAGDRAAEGKLKDIVTGDEHFIEFKGVDPIRVKNYVRLFVTGNHDWQIPAGFGERRFAVLDVGDAHKEDHSYFAAIDEEMDNGGREALLHHLLTFDLSSVNLRKIPETEALLEQKIASMSPEEAWWFDTLRRGELPRRIDEQGTCLRSALFGTYIEHANRQGARRRSIETQVGGLLCKFVPYLASNRRTVGRRREWVYTFPSLKDCRRAFARAMRHEVDWGEDWDLEEWQHMDIVDNHLF